eukprot:SM000021S06524  [mRNA]  locus=s21:1090113:1092955:+ [translate_table: standard]
MCGLSPRGGGAGAGVDSAFEAAAVAASHWDFDTLDDLLAEAAAAVPSYRGSGHGNASTPVTTAAMEAPLAAETAAREAASAAETAAEEEAFLAETEAEVASGDYTDSATSGVPHRREMLAEVEEALAQEVDMDGLGATRDGRSFKWARIFGRPGSPNVHKTNWRIPEGVGRFAFVRLDGSRVHNALDVALLLAGKSVALLGDSLTHQVHDMLILSLQKLGYEEYITLLDRTYYCNGTAADTREDLAKRRVLVDADSLDKEYREWHDRHCDTWVTTYHLGGPFRNMTWSYYRVYKLMVDGKKPWPAQYVLYPAVLDHIFETSDVVIPNLGLHYHMEVESQPEELRQHVAELAGRIERLSHQPGKLGFFRGMLPQHFYSTDGSGAFSKPETDDATAALMTCHEAKNIESQLWRDDIMEEEAGKRSVAVQSAFWEMDKHEFHFARQEGQARRDCTHFAYVPDWWAPVFDTMYRTGASIMCPDGANAPSKHCFVV